MRIMTLEEIKKKTLSTQMTKPNVVYKITQECDGVNFKHMKMHAFRKDDLVCVSGCGELHKSGQTQVFVDDYWVKVPNPCLDHYANPILQRIQ